MFSQWCGILTGPIVFLAVLEADFALVPWACGEHLQWLLYLVTGTGVAVTAGAGLLAGHRWHQTGKAWPTDAGGALERSRFMAALGMLLNAFFVLVILAHGVTNLLLEACE